MIRTHFVVVACGLILAGCSDGPVDGPSFESDRPALEKSFFDASEGVWSAKSGEGKSFEVFLSGGRLIVSSLSGEGHDGRIMGYYDDAMVEGEIKEVGFDERTGSLSDVGKASFESRGDRLILVMDDEEMILSRPKKDKQIASSDVMAKPTPDS